MATTTITAPSASLADRFKEISQQNGISQEAITQYNELILLAIEEDNQMIHIECQLQLGRIYVEQGLAYKALRFTGTALQLINRHAPDDKDIRAICYKELGVIYANGLKKYSIALDYFFKALNCNESSLTVSLYNNIGSVYKDSGRFDEAIKYLKLGQELATDDNQLFKIFILENMGKVYLLQHDFTSAEEALLEGLKLSDAIISHNNTNTTALYIRGFVLNSLAELYLKTKRQQKALPFIQEALNTAVEHNHLVVIIESLKNRSTYALQVDDNNLFLETIKSAIDYCEKENLIHEGESCLKLLKDYHWSQGNYRDACIIGDKIIEQNTKVKKTHESNSMADILEQRESKIVLLEEDNRLINQQKEDLKQFAYIVAHDLKEPLRNIGSYSSLVKRRYASAIDAEGVEFLDFVVNSSSHMYKMLEDLLKYVTLNEQDNSIEMLAPKPVIDNIVYRLKDRINETKTQIIYGEMAPVFIRSTHLSVLLENLIKNAIKFQSPNRTPVIEILMEEQQDHFRFEVKDNGKGIQSQFFDNIFQIFKRLEKNAYPGTGIGLSICKKIVESYHGKIWVESKVGEGTSFFFTLAKQNKL